MPEYGITSGLPQLPVTDNKLFSQLLPLYNAVNALAKPIADLKGQVTYSQAELAGRNGVFSLTSQYGNRIFAKAAAVALPLGVLVNLYVSGVELAAQLADATPGIVLQAHGIVSAPQGIELGDIGEITVLSGYSSGIHGTAVGQNYWLSATGLVQPAAPAAVGALVQGVGIGLGSAGFLLQISTQIHLV